MPQSTNGQPMTLEQSPAAMVPPCGPDTTDGYDVVIVGAGFSGLRAACELQQRGLHVQVVEARERVGGRSCAAMLNGRVVDVGGQWLGVDHQRLRALADQAGATIRAQYTTGDKLIADAGVVRRYRGLIPPVSPLGLLEFSAALARLRRLQSRVPADSPWQAHDAAALDAVTVQQWQARWIRTAGGRRLFDAALRAVLCTEASKLSMLGFLHYLSSNRSFEYLVSADDGAQAHVIEGGMHALSRHLASQLHHGVSYETPVLAIEQHANQATLRLAGGRRLSARRVIVAMSPLLASRIDMPGISVERHALGQRMPMGSVIKCLVAYRSPFWRASGLSGEFVGSDSLLSPVFDASPADASHGVLVGFIDGARALRWSADAAARRRAVIESLVHSHGPQAADPIDYVDQDWTAERYSLGCYVGVPTPGTLSSLGTALRAPSGLIHWAGTETAEAWCGYIEGALQAGERVAREVAAAMA